MDDLAKTIRYNDLFALYQELLTKTQKDILSDYLAYDLSLGEIAINRHVSRSAVEDALRKGLKKLDDFESRLHLLDKKIEILKITTQIKQNNQNKETKDLVSNIERIIR
ncbi:MAG: transcriptional regulator [Erysipelotrichaceae bacterium]|nr:transcriptional regulator [Erysipelotrichaceae bacterium]